MWHWFFPKWDSIKDLSTSSLLEAKTIRSNSTIELEIIACLGFRIYILAINKIIFSTFSQYNATSQEKYHHAIW